MIKKHYISSLLILAALLLIHCDSDAQEVKPADNPVIAHRGAWKSENLPQNSVAALKQAIQLETAGSEFDVLMTADDSLVVTHGPDYHNLPVEETNYEKLAAFKFSNGEKLPTLRQYIRAGIENNKITRLICEIKPSKISKERGKRIAEKVVQLIGTLEAEQMVTYISFDYDILEKVIELKPEARTQYLAGDKPPEQLKADGISGADYNFAKYKEHPKWIESAKQKGITLNAWTVNKAADMNWLLERGFDFITTDEPELLFQQLKNTASASDYTLVRSDEFNYTGRSDSTKWGYEYGFVRKQ